MVIWMFVAAALGALLPVLIVLCVYQIQKDRSNGDALPASAPRPRAAQQDMAMTELGMAVERGALGTIEEGDEDWGKRNNAFPVNSVTFSESLPPSPEKTGRRPQSEAAMMEQKTLYVEDEENIYEKTPDGDTSSSDDEDDAHMVKLSNMRIRSPQEAMQGPSSDEMGDHVRSLSVSLGSAPGSRVQQAVLARAAAAGPWPTDAAATAGSGKGFDNEGDQWYTSVDTSKRRNSDVEFYTIPLAAKAVPQEQVPEEILEDIKARLRADNVKLWLLPYSDERGDGNIPIATVDRYSSASGFDRQAVFDAMEYHRIKAFNRKVRILADQGITSVIRERNVIRMRGLNEESTDHPSPSPPRKHESPYARIPGDATPEPDEVLPEYRFPPTANLETEPEAEEAEDSLPPYVEPPAAEHGQGQDEEDVEEPLPEYQAPPAVEQDDGSDSEYNDSRIRENLGYLEVTDEPENRDGYLSIYDDSALDSNNNRTSYNGDEHDSNNNNDARDANDENDENESNSNDDDDGKEEEEEEIDNSNNNEYDESSYENMLNVGDGLAFGNSEFGMFNDAAAFAMEADTEEDPHMAHMDNGADYGSDEEEDTHESRVIGKVHPDLRHNADNSYHTQIDMDAIRTGKHLHELEQAEAHEIVTTDHSHDKHIGKVHADLKHNADNYYHTEIDKEAIDRRHAEQLKEKDEAEKARIEYERKFGKVGLDIHNNATGNYHTDIDIPDSNQADDQCEGFVPQLFRKDLCQLCFKKKNTHANLN